MKNRAGEYRKNLSGEAECQSFVPARLPPNPTIDLGSDMLKALIKANNSVSALEGIAKRIPSMDLLLQCM